MGVVESWPGPRRDQWCSVHHRQRGFAQRAGCTCWSAFFSPAVTSGLPMVGNWN